jgi:hypothetical protein
MKRYQVLDQFLPLWILLALAARFLRPSMGCSSPWW